ncbi:hypothetical protein K438DRAFT_1980955 [Mycena galopus ATCC 62051]|nr:hypothetical protein K438DRAFT_1980955 [Mycena galopus ATCC 62051]
MSPAKVRSPANQEYVDSLTARRLMDFRNYLFFPTYITHNAGQFLNDEWVGIGLFREYLQRTAQGPVSDAVPKHSSPAPSGPVRVKTEAPASLIPASLIPAFVKAEPEPVDLPHASGDIKLRTLNEDGHEIFELLSDSDAGEDHDSDQEVIEALRRTSRSASAIPPSVADDVNDDIEVAKSGGVPPHDDENFLASDDWDEDDLSEDAADDLPAQDDSDSPLVESDTVWEDGATSFVRTGMFHPMRSVTVNRMEYCNGPASVYLIHRTRTGLVVDMSHEKYHSGHPTTKELYSINSIIQNSDNDSWKTKGGSGKAEVVFAPGEATLDFTFGLKDTYRQCIDAHGVLGAMVAKVDNAQSTRMVLSGKKPSEHAPALHNKRIKNDLLHAKKIEKYPNGLGVEGDF